MILARRKRLAVSGGAVVDVVKEAGNSCLAAGSIYTSHLTAYVDSMLTTGTVVEACMSGEPLSGIESDQSIAGLGESVNSLVIAGVGGDGVPLKLAIKPAAMKLSPDELAQEIIGALRAAHQAAGEGMLRRLESMGSESRLPSPRRVQETLEQARADVSRQVEEAKADLEDVRRRLSGLLG